MFSSWQPLLLLLLPSAETIDANCKIVMHYLHSCFLAQKQTLFQALISLASLVSDNMPIQGSRSCTLLEDILLTRCCRARYSRGVFAGDLRVLNEPSGTDVCTGILTGQFNSFGSFSWKKEEKVKSCCLGPSSEEPYSGMPQDRVKI